MKSKLLGITSAVVLTSSVLLPDIIKADLSANVAMVNDYRFRGISQNDQSFALQGESMHENIPN